MEQNNSNRKFKGKILVAEDNVINQKVITTILKKNGYQYDLAQNGQEAVDRLAEEKFNLILMDCQMPIVDGLQATTIIREKENIGHLEHCPIVALTANAMAGDREKCLASGMDDFLAKPFKMEDLLQKIDEWIAQDEKKDRQ